MEQKTNLKRNEEFINAAKASIAPIDKKANPRRKRNPKNELRDIFVTASKIRKKTKNKDIKTQNDEWVLNGNGEYVLSSSSYRYRFAFLKLKESLDEEKLLTGRIDSIEEIDGYWSAVLFFGVFKVIIPIFEMLDVNINKKEDRIGEDAKHMLSRRLGGVIDFVVKYLDESSGIAIASRTLAVRKKEDFFFHKNPPLVHEGDTVQGKVVATARGGINLEVMGVEVFLPSYMISKRYLVDASVLYHNGENVEVVITKIAQNEKGGIELEASVSKVKEAAVMRIREQIVPNKKYVGKVTSINKFGIFVNIVLGDDNFDVLCAVPSFGIIPTVGANVAINITQNTEKGFFGVIQHVSVV